MINVKAIAEKRKALLKEIVAADPRFRVQNTIRVMQFGEDPASCAYICGKVKDCEEIGLKCEVERIPIANTRAEIVEQRSHVKYLLHCWTMDSKTLGIIVQQPVPGYMENFPFATYIQDTEDLDGICKEYGSEFTPCTAVGVKIILDEIGFNPSGKICMVVGRGDIAGRPIAEMLENMDATVIRCNSHTSPSTIGYFLGKADLLVSAVGKQGLFGNKVTENTTRIGQLGNIAIDVGISRGEEGKLHGDISKRFYSDDAMITPVPGGVGLMTRVGLLENAVYGPYLAGGAENDIRKAWKKHLEGKAVECGREGSGC